MNIAAATQPTGSESKPLGVVRIECPYPVVTLALREILKDVADVYEAGRRLPEMKDPSCVVLYPNGEDVASEMRRLRASDPDAAVLLFNLDVDPQLVREALLMGACGYLHAGMRPEQIVRAVRLASESRVLCPDGLLEKDKPIAKGPAMANLAVLTPRQRQILELLCEGLSNAQIAERLFLTESTVKQHLYAAYKLLKVRNRIQAARMLRL